MAVDWNQEALEQLELHWQMFLRPRLDGLTDDEYFWEPVPDCWSVRPRDEARTPFASGQGDYLIDFAMPQPDPPPVTTIAWRMAHMTVGIFGMRVSNHFGDGSLSYETAVYPETAQGALAALDEAYAAWTTAIAKLDGVGMAAAVGPAEGPYADRPFATLVLHINREAIHHGAEIALLRDLYRAGVGAPSTDDTSGVDRTEEAPS